MFRNHDHSRPTDYKVSHFRMYKKGKTWLFASALLFSAGVMLGLTPKADQVHAAENNAGATAIHAATAAQSDSSTVTLSAATSTSSSAASSAESSVASSTSATSDAASSAVVSSASATVQSVANSSEASSASAQSAAASSVTANSSASATSASSSQAASSEVTGTSVASSTAANDTAAESSASSTSAVASTASEATSYGSPQTKSGKTQGAATVPENTTLTDFSSMFTGWTKTSITSASNLNPSATTISVTTSNGKTVSVNAFPNVDINFFKGADGGIFGGTVTINGQQYTYASVSGTASNSAFYWIDASATGDEETAIGLKSKAASQSTLTSPSVVYKSADGRSVAKIINSQEGLIVVDTATLTTAGTVQHVVKFLNPASSKKTYSNIFLGSHLDTAIQSGGTSAINVDITPIYSDGKGGLYITSAKTPADAKASDVTLYLTPGDNAYLFGMGQRTVKGVFSDSSYAMQLGISSTGAIVVQAGKDIPADSSIWGSGVQANSAVNYQTGLISSFAPGQMVTMTYSERLQSANDIVATVHYVDKNTNKDIATQQVIGNDSQVMKFKSTADYMTANKGTFDGYSVVTDNSIAANGKNFAENNTDFYVYLTSRHTYTPDNANGYNLTTTVHEVVNYTLVDGTTKSTSKDVQMYRSVTVEGSTVNYTPWTTSKDEANSASSTNPNAKVTVPALTDAEIKQFNTDTRATATVTSTAFSDGTASLTGTHANDVVTVTAATVAKWTDATGRKVDDYLTVTRNVAYTLTPATLTVQYVDLDNGSKVVDAYTTTDTTSYVVGDSGNVTATLPAAAGKAGYVLAPTAQQTKLAYAFTTNKTATATVYLQHARTTPAVPATGDPAYDETHKVVTLSAVLNADALDATTKATITAAWVANALTNQQLNFTRTVTFDQVTQKAVAYGAWTFVPSGDHAKATYADLTPTDLSTQGYTVAPTKVTGDTTAASVDGKTTGTFAQLLNAFAQLNDGVNADGTVTSDAANVSATHNYNAAYSTTVKYSKRTDVTATMQIKVAGTNTVLATTTMTGTLGTTPTTQNTVMLPAGYTLVADPTVQKDTAKFKQSGSQFTYAGQLSMDDADNATIWVQASAATLAVKYLDVDANATAASQAVLDQLTQTDQSHKFGDQGAWTASVPSSLVNQYALAATQDALTYAFTDGTKLSQTVTVKLVHKATPATTPTATTDPNYNLTHKVLTVQVVVNTSNLTTSDAAAAQKLTQATQNFAYTRTVTVDAVTGKALTLGAWQASVLPSYATVQGVALDGYQMNGAPVTVTSTATVKRGTTSATIADWFSNFAKDNNGGVAADATTANFDTTVTATISYTADAQTVQYLYKATVTDGQHNVSTITLDPDQLGLATQYPDAVHVHDVIKVPSAPTIAGYTADSTKNVTSFTVTATAVKNVVTYYYTGNQVTDANSVTARFVDKNGTNLAPSKTYAGTVGGAWNAGPASVTGYTLSSVQVDGVLQPTLDTPQGTFDDVTHLIVYTYQGDVVKPEDQSALTVYHYLRRADGTATTTTVPGMQATNYGGVMGDTWTVDLTSNDHQAPAGYTLVTTVAPTGKFVPSRHSTAILYYQASQEVVNVAYKAKVTDADGTQHEITLDGDKLQLPTTFNNYRFGDIISSADLTAPTISGYTVDTAANVTEYTVVHGTNAITFHYVGERTDGSDNPDVNGTVTVKYLNVDTQAALSAQRTLNGTVGGAWTATAATIDGYTVDHIDLDGQTVTTNSGNFDTTAHTLTYYYKGAVADGFTVHHYLEGTSTAVPGMTDSNVTGNVGDNWSVTLSDSGNVAPAGYQLTAGQSDQKGTLSVDGNADVNLYYFAVSQVVTPEDPKSPGEHLNPSNDNSPEFPAGVDQNDLNRTATRTVQFLDAKTGHKVADTVTQKLYFTRTATVNLATGKVTAYGAWTLDGSKDTEFAQVNVPAVSGKTANKSVVEAMTETHPVDVQATVYYYDNTLTIDPGIPGDQPTQPGDPTGPKGPDTPIDPKDPTGPKYPAGVNDSDLNRTATRTVQFLDAKTGHKLADTVTQMLHFTRTATIDLASGKVTAYGAWTLDGNKGTEFAQVNVPAVSGKAANKSVVEAMTETHPVDVQATVYYYDNTLTIDPGIPGDQPTKPGDPTGPKAPDTPIDPKDPTGPQYPAGVNDSDLNRTATRTVQFLDAKTGHKVATTVTQTLHFTRTATINLASGKVTAYGAWTLDPTKGTEFAQVDVPAVAGKTANKTEVEAMTETHPVDVQATVYYYDNTLTIDPGIPGDQPTEPGDPTGPKAPDTPIDPKDPTGPQYPAGVNGSDLNRTATRTVQFLDAKTGHKVAKTVTQTLHFTRTATIDLSTGKVTSYGAWTLDPTKGTEFGHVDVPAVAGKTANKTEVEAMTETHPVDVQATVYYYDNTLTIDPGIPGDQPTKPGDPTGPKAPDTPIDPKDLTGPKYPAGVNDSDLNRTATRTVQFLDAKTGHKVATTVTQTLYFTRTATVDLSTGKVTAYGAWTLDGSKDTEFAQVNVPAVSGKTANKSVIEAMTETHPVDVQATVYYYDNTLTIDPGIPGDQPTKPGDPTGPKAPETPIDPKDLTGPKYPAGVNDSDLNRTATRTVQFLDAKTGHKVATTVTQTLYFTRTATIDLSTGKVTAYGAWALDPTKGTEFAQVDVPAVAGKTANKTEVEAMAETHPVDVQATVYYYDNTLTIDPGIPGDQPTEPGDPTGPKAPETPIDPKDPTGPKYPAGVNDADLHRTATRTVQFLDAKTGHKLADTVMQTLHFTRTATIDLSTGKVTAYGAWTLDTTKGTEFAQVDVPAVAGKTANKALVEAMTETHPVDVQATVYYYDNTLTIDPGIPGDQPTKPGDPTGPKAPETPIDPEDPTGPKYPAGVNDADLNRTATRTAQFLDAKTGHKVAKTVTQTLHFTRTATIDLASGKVTAYGGWTLDTTKGTEFAQMNVPAVAGKTANKTSVEAMTETHPVDVQATVYYYDNTLTIDPGIPGDQPTKPGDPTGPKAPDTPIDPEDPTGPKYPAGVNDADLNRTATRTVQFLDAKTGHKVAKTVTQTLHFTRTATIDLASGKVTAYGGWTLDTTKGTEFAQMNVPAVAGKTANKTSVEAMTETHPVDVQATVYYYDNTLTIDPGIPGDQPTKPGDPTGPKAPDTPIDPKDPTGPKYPAGVNDSDLNRTATRTVQFLDAKTGHKVATTVTQTLHFTRTATIDLASGKVMAYGAWTLDGNKGTEFAQVNVPAVSGKTANKSVVEAMTETHPVDVQATVYYYDNTLTIDPGIPGDQPTEPGDPTGPKAPETPIDPTDPTGPKYPAGVNDADLNRTATRTVQFLDAKTGHKVATTVTQTLHFTRTATIDLASGKVMAYGAWTLDGNKGTEFAQVNVPAVSGKTANKSVVEVMTETHPVDVQATVYYYDNTLTIDPGIPGDQPTNPGDPTGPKAPDTPIDPTDPTGPKYPAGVNDSDLNRTATRTVQFLDAKTGHKLADTVTQTLHFTREAIIDLSTGDVTSYSAWTLDTTKGTEFAQIDVPAVNGKTANKTSVEAMTETHPVDVQATVYYYDNTLTIDPGIPGDQPTEPGDPTGPKAPDTPIDPKDPTGPKYPAGVNDSDLNRTATRTVQFLDAKTGHKLAETVTQTLHFTRTATVDLASGKVTAYGAWTLDTTKGTEFAQVNVPTVSGKTANKTLVEAMTETHPVDVQATVYYYDNTLTIDPGIPGDQPTNPGDPTGPKAPDTPIDPKDPTGPKYPAGVNDSDLNRTATRTVQFLDAKTGHKVADTVTQTLNFTRTARIDLSTGKVTAYGAWKLDTTKGTEFAQVDVPAVAGKTANKTEVEAMTETHPVDVQATVYYYDNALTIDPGIPGDQPTKPGDPTGPKAPETPIDPKDPTGPHYPTGVNDADLNRTATRTVQFLDAKTGHKVAPTVTQTLHFTRTATIDLSTGKVTAYGTWTLDPTKGTEFAQVDVPVVDGQTANRNVVEAMTETHPVDVQATVYYYDNTLTIDPGIPGNQPTEPSDPTGPKAPETPIDPKDPTGPNYPAGVNDSDLNRTATRTVQFLDAKTGHKVADSVTQTLHFTRTATINLSTGKVTAYGAWTLDTTKGTEFGRVDVPAVAGKTANRTSVEAMTETHPVDVQATVYYYDNTLTIDPGIPGDQPTEPGDPTGPKAPETPIDPKDPTGPQYPAGVNDSDLNRTATRTVQFLDAKTGHKVADTVTQTLNFTRTATIDLSTGKVTAYGAWALDPTKGTEFAQVDVPAVDGKTANRTSVEAMTETHPVDVQATVYYYDNTLTIDPGIPGDQPTNPGDPTGPKAPDTPIDPKDPTGPKYPAGVNDSDLNRTATRTVQFLDAKTGHKLAPTVTQMLHFTREAIIDLSTGEVTSYSAWTLDTTKGTEFVQVDVPAVDGKTANKTVVEAMTETHPVDVQATVYYYDNTLTIDPGIPGDQPTEPGDPTGPKAPETPIDPKDPTGPKYPAGVNDSDLNRTATRTVQFLDAKTGHKVAPTVTQTLHFTREAIIDLSTGEVTSYSAWVLDSTKGTEFAQVDVPAVAGKTANKTSVEAMTETHPVDVQATVYYYDNTLTIDPEIPGDQPTEPSDPTGPKAPETPIDPADPTGPKYPAGVAVDNLTRTAHLVVRYVDGVTNAEIAQSYNASLDYTRTATTDLETGSVNYGAWVPVTTDVFSRVISPQVPGYFADQTVIDAMANADAADVGLVVYYYPTTVQVTPTDPHLAGDPLDPSNPAGPTYPAGVDKASLVQTATQTIDYVDANGQPIATSSRQQLDFGRTATITYTQTIAADGTRLALVGKVAYGDWTAIAGNNFAAVTSPVITGMTPDRSVVASMQVEGPFAVHLVVAYFPTVQTVTVDNPKTPADTLNPANPDSPHYPSGVAADDLRKVTTRTIHFVDGSGRQVAPDVVQVLGFTRTATVDFANPAAPTVKYGDWVPTTTDQFTAVDVPAVSGLVPESTVVAAADGTVDREVTVTFSHVSLPNTGGQPTHLPEDSGQPVTLPQTGGQPVSAKSGDRAAARTLPATGSQSKAKVVAKSAKEQTRTLPQTGDDHGVNAVALGIAMLSGFFALLGFRRRRDDED